MFRATTHPFLRASSKLLSDSWRPRLGVCSNAPVPVPTPPPRGGSKVLRVYPSSLPTTNDEYVAVRVDNRFHLSRGISALIQTPLHPIAPPRANLWMNIPALPLTSERSVRLPRRMGLRVRRLRLR